MALGQIKKANDGAAQRTLCEDQVVEKYKEANQQ
jgi:hypothetical protein